MDGAAEYLALGRDEWIRRRAEAANKGYEHSTGKCYRVTIQGGEWPSPSYPVTPPASQVLTSRSVLS